jgi:hypothetical protein
MMFGKDISRYVLSLLHYSSAKKHSAAKKYRLKTLSLYKELKELYGKDFPTDVYAEETMRNCFSRLITAKQLKGEVIDNGLQEAEINSNALTPVYESELNSTLFDSTENEMDGIEDEPDNKSKRSGSSATPF